MPIRTRMLLLNSATAFTLALMVMFTIHEFGHAVAALGFGLQPTVRPFSVDYQGATRSQEVIIALSGPFVSLGSGIVFLFASRLVYRPTFWHLVLMWLGALSVQEFSGYLMTGPFVPFGDIGRALFLVSAPAWAYVLCVIVGALGTVLLGAVVTRWLLELTDPDGADRSAQLRSLGLFAWLAGSGAVILIGGIDNVFSPVGFFEVLGTLTVGLFLTLVRLFMGREHPVPRGSEVGWPVAGLILLLAAAAARHFVLGPGLRL